MRAIQVLHLMAKKAQGYYGMRSAQDVPQSLNNNAQPGNGYIMTSQGLIPRQSFPALGGNAAVNTQGSSTNKNLAPQPVRTQPGAQSLTNDEQFGDLRDILNAPPGYGNQTHGAQPGMQPGMQQRGKRTGKERYLDRRDYTTISPQGTLKSMVNVPPKANTDTKAPVQANQRGSGASKIINVGNHSQSGGK